MYPHCTLQLFYREARGVGVRTNDTYLPTYRRYDERGNVVMGRGRRRRLNFIKPFVARALISRYTSSKEAINAKANKLCRWRCRVLLVYLSFDIPNYHRCSLHTVQGKCRLSVHIVHTMYVQEYEYISIYLRYSRYEDFCEKGFSLNSFNRRRYVDTNRNPSKTVDREMGFDVYVVQIPCETKPKRVEYFSVFVSRIFSCAQTARISGNDCKE